MGQVLKLQDTHLFSKWFSKCAEVSIKRELWREKFELIQYRVKIRALLIPDRKDRALCPRTW